jgi:hypothetical protein
METSVIPNAPCPPSKKTTGARIDVISNPYDVDTTDDDTNSSFSVKKNDKIKLLEQLYIAAHIVDNNGVILWANSYEVRVC